MAGVCDRPPPMTQPPPPPGSRYCEHMVNERPVRILLECILVETTLRTVKIVFLCTIFHHIKLYFPRKSKSIICGYGLAPGWKRSQIYGPRVMNLMPLRVQWSARNALVLVYGLGDHISPQLNMTTFTLLPPIFIVMFSAIAHQTCSPRNWSLRMGVLHNRTFLTLL